MNAGRQCELIKFMSSQHQGKQKREGGRQKWNGGEEAAGKDGAQMGGHTDGVEMITALSPCPNVRPNPPSSSVVGCTSRATLLLHAVRLPVDRRLKSIFSLEGA